MFLPRTMTRTAQLKQKQLEYDKYRLMTIHLELTNNTYKMLTIE